MASIIRLKRSGITPVPNTLASGELAYSWETSTKGKLYIGWGDELTAGVAPNIAAIGGKYYTDLVSDRISHTPGELTISSALIVDNTGTIDQIKVGNLDLNESTITSTITDSNIIINPNGTGKTIISDLYINDDATSLSAYIEQVAGGAIIAGAGLLSTAGTGAEEGSTILSVRVDNSTIEIKGVDDDILQLKDSGITNIKIAETTIANSKLVNSSVTIAGTTGSQSLSLGGTFNITGADSSAISTDVTAGSLKIAVATATTTTLGVAKFATADFGVSVAGEVTLDKSVIKSITTDNVGGPLVSTTNAISILGGTAIGVTHSGSVITVAADIATTSAVGVASFNTGEFTVTGAGEVAINAGGIGNNKLANSAITLGTTLLTLGNTGATAVLELAGLQKLNVDNIQIDNNDITSTAGDINITALAGNDVNITATGLGNIGLSVASGQEITLSTLAVADLTENGIIVAGADGALETNTNLTFNGTTTTLDLNGTLEVGNISITGNTISSIDTNGNIVLSPNGTGETRGTVDVSSARITNVGSPTTGTDAANKQYVDDVAQGLKILPQAIAFSNSNLSATYNNGTAGVGATLTASANGTFPTIDGITLAVDENVIINGQTNKAQNGSYILTTVGSAGTPWVLTRAPFIDQASEMEGSFEFVTSGTDFGNTGWVLTSLTEPVVVGTTDLTWVQFSGAGTYTNGDGINLTGTKFSAKVDDISISINAASKAIEIKPLGITDGLIANDTISNGKLVNSKIVIQDQNAVTDDVSLGDTLTFTVGTGTGITTAVTANTVTISGINASETVKGVASFNADHFTVDTGVVSLDTEGVQDIVLAAIEATANTGISVTYNDEPDNKLAIAGIDAAITVKGVAKFGGYSSTVFDSVNNVDTGVENTNSARQFSVTDGNVRIVALDGGTF